MPVSIISKPVTEERLRHDLKTIGVTPGTSLIVHSSLKAMGWVLGGAPTVIRALIGAVGEQGHLAMPAATPLCADPATWREPVVPAAWLNEIRHHSPVFDLQTTPTGLGAIPETLRTWPGTLRSNHPLESVCVRGPQAAAITEDHPLAFSEGPGSPFSKLHDLDSRILLIGVGFNRCTALHFAESLVPGRRTTKVRFPRMDGSRRVWIEVPNVADDNGTQFPAIGAEYLATGRATQGRIGDANAVYLGMRDLVTHACTYFNRTHERANSSLSDTT
jgi:aminoglycoside 3-N-acetyltransferase